MVDQQDGTGSAGRTAPPETPERATALGAEAVLERFATSFEASARRWELVVYPSLFAFIVLAVYGFYLVYSLTKDMHTLARSVDPQMSANMEVMAHNIADLARNIETMTRKMDEMTTRVTAMDTHIRNMDEHMLSINDRLGEISTEMRHLGPMRASMEAMTVNTGVMTRDMGTLSRPFTWFPFR